MAYQGNFQRNPKGKFNPLLNFVAIKGGTDAYLLEDELNELQWIQTEEHAKLVRAITKSGSLNKPHCLETANTDELGAIHAHKYLIRDDQDNIIQAADSITSENELNTITLNPFNVVLNGYLAHIESNKPEGLRLQFTDPDSRGQKREDFVILEFWFAEIAPNDKVYLYGGVDNTAVNYELVDKRISLQTTNRVQLQWRLRVITDHPEVPGIEKLHYDNGHTDVALLEIHPQGPKKQEIGGLTFSTHPEDDQVFIAGDGMNTIMTTGTIDGYIYAIPLFEVSRLNTAGYNAIHNTRGGTLWEGETTVTDRVSLDGKFSNVIYTNDINDQRFQAYLGTSQLDSRYVNIQEFSDVVSNLNVLVNNLTTANNDLKQELELVGDELQSLHEENDKLKEQLNLLTMITL